MCNVCGGGTGSDCVSPLATWMVPWLPEDPGLRVDLLCYMLDFQYKCVDSQINSDEVSERQKKYLRRLRDHLDKIRERLECPQEDE